MSIRNRVAPLVLAAAISIASSTAANAATTVFNFGANGAGLNTGTNPDTYALAVGGLTVNVRAYNGLSAITNAVSFASQADVTHAATGLGVAGNDSGEINDNGLLSTGEGLLLIFSQSVDLTQAVFGNFGSGDAVGFEFGSPIAAGETLDALSAPGGTWNGSRVGTQFFFAANSFAGHSFRLRGVTVNYTPTSGAVPEPATWAMMILGFGLIGGFMRRRQNHAQVRFNFA